jgi:hypothetical protein
MLLLYGDKTEEFEDVLWNQWKGKLNMYDWKKAISAAEFVKLTEDEVELANPLFVIFQRFD